MASGRLNLFGGQRGDAQREQRGREELAEGSRVEGAGHAVNALHLNVELVHAGDAVLADGPTVGPVQGDAHGRFTDGELQELVRGDRDALGVAASETTQGGFERLDTFRVAAQLDGATVSEQQTDPFEALAEVGVLLGSGAKEVQGGVTGGDGLGGDRHRVGFHERATAHRQVGQG